MPVTVGSSAREVGKRKLNFGNPAERQGIRFRIRGGAGGRWTGQEGQIVSSTSLSAPADRPFAPSSAQTTDPYSEIEQLSPSARARAALLGVLIAALLAALAVGTALLYTAAVFGYPGGGS
jgi:hypothetical protein